MLREAIRELCSGEGEKERKRGERERRESEGARQGRYKRVHKEHDTLYTHTQHIHD